MGTGHKILSFAVNLAVFSLVILAVSLILFTTLLKEHYLPVYWIVFIYFITIVLVSRIFVFFASPEGKDSFNRRYFISTLLKFLLHLTFIVIYLVTHDENILPFVITFLSAYLVFTLFDAYTLQRFIKKSKQF